MNLLSHQAAELSNEIQHFLNTYKAQCEVCIFPSSVYLPALRANTSSLNVGAQNVYSENSGAYTGEISLSQLESIGVDTVLIGHSERRSIFNESDTLINEKILKAVEANFKVFFCIGELLEERKSDKHFNIVEEQIKKGLAAVSENSMSKIVLAYEPVWAIGTGETASPEQAQEMHAHVRRVLSNLYSKESSNNTSILYGGSVKPANAKELFGQPDVNGGLVGGASLNATDFIDIIKAFG